MFLRVKWFEIQYGPSVTSGVRMQLAAAVACGLATAARARPADPRVAAHTTPAPRPPSATSASRRRSVRVRRSRSSVLMARTVWRGCKTALRLAADACKPIRSTTVIEHGGRPRPAHLLDERPSAHADRRAHRPEHALDVRVGEAARRV